MLQKFNVVPIPEVESPADARELLHRFARSDLPALAIRNAGTEGLEAAIDGISADLPPGVETEATTAEFEFGDAGWLGHVGLHYDHEVPEVGSEDIPISWHLTESGIAVASLFAVGPRFTERAVGHRAQVDHMRREMEENFRAGVVDTDVMDPTNYQTTVTPGTLLVFKNGAPYWHIFDTQGTGRRSVVHDSTMAARPEMNLAFRNPAQTPDPPTVNSQFPSL
jgi:hypothetical protein